MKPAAQQPQIDQLVDEYTWMGGNAGGLSGLLACYTFESSTIEAAIDNVMSRHSCSSTYHSALACKDVLERALKEIDKST